MLSYQTKFTINLQEPFEPVIGPTEPLSGFGYFVKVLNSEPVRLRAGFAFTVTGPEGGSILAFHWLKGGFWSPLQTAVLPAPSWAESFYFVLCFTPGRRIPSAEPQLEVYF